MFTSKPAASAIDAVQHWYDERAAYDFSKEPTTAVGPSLSQLLWAGSSLFGAGKSEDGEYIVAQFSPPGNITGQYLQNVLVALPSELLELTGAATEADG